MGDKGEMKKKQNIFIRMTLSLFSPLALITPFIY